MNNWCSSNPTLGVEACLCETITIKFSMGQGTTWVEVWFCAKELVVHDNGKIK